jgi:hypothetical protein
MLLVTVSGVSPSEGEVAFAESDQPMVAVEELSVNPSTNRSCFEELTHGWIPRI